VRLWRRSSSTSCAALCRSCREGARLRGSPPRRCRGYRHPHGSKCITEDLGISWRTSSRGSRQSKKITADKDNTTIVEGRGKRQRHPRAGQADPAQIEETTSDYDREKLQERLAKLVGGSPSSRSVRPRKPR